MSNALAIAVQSLQNDLQRMDALSQNMVNTTTPGYRRVIPVAREFAEAMRGDGAGTPATSLSSLTPVLGTALDLSPGAIKQTGQHWDVAIPGEGYFELSAGDGPAYTRAGNFHLDHSGRLVSQDGFAVQGIGGDIVANGSDAAVDHLGRVIQDGEIIGQIKIVRFANAKAMVKTATGLLRPDGANNTATVENLPELLVGSLESSNVSSIREMVTMMETTRHFESVQKLYQGYDDTLANAIRKLGEL